MPVSSGRTVRWGGGRFKPGLPHSPPLVPDYLACFGRFSNGDPVKLRQVLRARERLVNGTISSAKRPGSLYRSTMVPGFSTADRFRTIDRRGRGDFTMQK